MKKWSYLVLVLVFVLGNTTAVSAAPKQPGFQVIIPETVVFGGRPFTMTVELTNRTRKSLKFDFKIKQLFKGATNRTTMVNYTTGEIYWGEGNSTGDAYWWRGEIKPGKSATFNMLTRSGNSLGTFEVFEVTDLKTNKVEAVKSLTLVAETEIPRIEIVNQGTDLYGDSGLWYTSLNISVYNSVLTSYKILVSPLNGCELEYDQGESGMYDSGSYSEYNYANIVRPVVNDQGMLVCDLMVSIKTGTGQILSKEIQIQLTKR